MQEKETKMMGRWSMMEGYNVGGLEDWQILGGITDNPILNGHYAGITQFPMIANSSGQI